MLVNIEAERVRKQMSKEKVASEMNVSTKTYYNWIKEKVDIPSTKLCALAKLFNVSMEYLLGRESGVKEDSEKEVTSY